MNIQEFQKDMGNITFYDAVLLDNNGDAYMDMPSARLIWMANLRKLRSIKLSYWDYKYALASDNNDSVELANVAAARNVLRNMPTTYDLTVAASWQELLIMFPDYVL